MSRFTTLDKINPSLAKYIAMIVKKLLEEGDIKLPNATVTNHYTVIGDTSLNTSSSTTTDPNPTILLEDNSLLDSIIVIPVSDSNVKCGTIVGGEDIIVEQVVTTDGVCFQLNLFSKTSRTLYFTGVPVGSKLVYLKKPL